MSVKASAWAWEQARSNGLSPGTFLTLLRLADHADDEGVCWPGIKRIAEATSQHDRSVRRQVGELEDLGLLKREERLRENGSHRSNRIFLPIPPPDNTPVPPWQNASTSLTPVSPLEPSVEPVKGNSYPPDPPRGKSSSAVERALNGSKRQRDVDALRAFDAEQFPSVAPEAVANARWRIKKGGAEPTVEAIRNFLCITLDKHQSCG